MSLIVGAGSPLSMAFNHIPFLPKILKRVLAIFAPTCCGGCCGCLVAAAPLFLLIAIVLAMLMIVANNPAERLFAACQADQGQNNPICREIQDKFGLTVGPSDLAAAGINIDDYRDLERRFGIPWFYLAAAEKVASDWGRADFSVFANNVPPAPVEAIAAHQNTVSILNSPGTDAGNGAPSGVTSATVASQAAADISRLTSPLRGGSYGLQLITKEEYTAFGKGLGLDATATDLSVTSTDSTDIPATSQAAGVGMAGALGGTGQSWIAFAAQVQRENSGNFRNHNAFNLRDAAGYARNKPTYPGQTGWCCSDGTTKYHDFAVFSTDGAGGAAAAQNYLWGAAKGAYGYARVVDAARSGSLDATARAIECSAWDETHYGAACPATPGKLWALSMNWAGANPGSVGVAATCRDPAGCAAGQWLDPWNRTGAGEIASRALLATYADLGKTGELITAPQTTNVPPDIVAMVNRLLDDYVAAEQHEVIHASGCEALNSSAGINYGGGFLFIPSPNCNDVGATLLDEMIGFQNVGVGPTNLCVGSGIECLPKPKYDPNRFVLFGDQGECGNLLGWHGWPESWPVVNCYRPQPVGALAQLYSQGMAGRGIEPATRYYVCVRLMTLRADGQLKWTADYSKGSGFAVLSDSDKTKAIATCEPFAKLVTAQVPLPIVPKPSDDAKTLAASLSAAMAPYYMSSDINPTVEPGTDVRNWDGLSKIMRTLYASPAIWGSEQKVLLPATTDHPTAGTFDLGQQNVYVDAIDRYAQEIYNDWAATVGSRADSDLVRARNIDLVWWADKGGLDPLLQKLITAGVNLDRNAVYATLIADGAVHEITDPLSPGCQPYALPGAVALDGRIDGDPTVGTSPTLLRFAAVVASDGSPPITPLADWAFTAAGRSARVDPLLLAAIAQVNSGLNFSAKTDSADATRSGLMGLRASDVAAFGPSVSLLGDPTDSGAQSALATALAALGLKADDPTPNALDPRWAAPIAAAELSARLTTFGGLEAALAAFRTDSATVRAAGSDLAKMDPALSAWVRKVRDTYSALAVRAGGTFAGGIGIGSGGIGGCWRFGVGIPAVADPVDPSRKVGNPPDPTLGVAMNFCLPELTDCGTVRIKKADGTWLENIPVVDYLDGDIGSADETDVAIRPGTVTALGLTGDGPWKVDLQIMAPASGGSAIRLPGGSTGTPGVSGQPTTGTWTWPKELTYETPAAAIAAIVAALAPPKVTTPRTFATLAPAWVTWSGCLVGTAPGPTVQDPLAADTATSMVTVSPWCPYLDKVHAALLELMSSNSLGGDVVSAYGVEPASSVGFVWPIGGATVTSSFEPRSFLAEIAIVVGKTTYNVHSGVDMVRGGCGTNATNARIVAAADGYLFIAPGLESNPSGVGWMSTSIIRIIHDDGLMTEYGHAPITHGAYNPSEDQVTPVVALLTSAIADRFKVASNIYVISYNGRTYRAVHVSAGETITRIGDQQGSNCHLHLGLGVYSTSKSSTAAPNLLTRSVSTTFHYQYANVVGAAYLASGGYTYMQIDPLEVLPKDPSITMNAKNPVYPASGGWPPALRPDLLGLASPMRFIRAPAPAASPAPGS